MQKIKNIIFFISKCKNAEFQFCIYFLIEQTVTIAVKNLKKGLISYWIFDIIISVKNTHKASSRGVLIKIFNYKSLKMFETLWR